MAEVSNPFLIVRTILKIKGARNGTLYKINEFLFAIIFIPVRMVITPLALIYVYEADQVIYGTKFGVAFVLFVQLIWGYQIMNLMSGALVEMFPKSAPVGAFHKFTEILAKNQKVRKVLFPINAILIFLVPHYYYGFIRKTLFNFL